MQILGKHLTVSTLLTFSFYRHRLLTFPLFLAAVGFLVGHGLLSAVAALVERRRAGARALVAAAGL